MSFCLPTLPRCQSLPLAFRNRSKESASSFAKAITRTATSSYRMTFNSTGGERKKKRALIITGYACIGKTYFCSNLGAQLWKHLNLGRVMDLDSSSYSRDRFPENYLEDIRRKADEFSDEGCIILVSTFPGVGSKLKEEGYYVAQVFPQGNLDTKQEWLKRLENREKDGKDSRLYRLLDQHWDEWYDGMIKRNVSKTIEVSSDEYLSTVIEEICRDFQSSQLDTAS